MFYAEMMFGVLVAYKSVFDFFTPKYIKEYEQEILEEQIKWYKTIFNASINYSKDPQDAREKNLRILGLDSFATKKDIKKAYRKKAMLWHPDRNNLPEAEEKFKAIQKAFESLCE